MEVKVYELGDRVEMKKKTPLWEFPVGNHSDGGRYQNQVSGMWSYCYAAAI